MKERNLFTCWKPSKLHYQHISSSFVIKKYYFLLVLFIFMLCCVTKGSESQPLSYLYLPIIEYHNIVCLRLNRLHCFERCWENLKPVGWVPVQSIDGGIKSRRDSREKEVKNELQVWWSRECWLYHDSMNYDIGKRTLSVHKIYWIRLLIHNLSVIAFLSFPLNDNANKSAKRKFEMNCEQWVGKSYTFYKCCFFFAKLLIFCDDENQLRRRRHSTCQLHSPLKRSVIPHSVTQSLLLAFFGEVFLLIKSTDCSV